MSSAFVSHSFRPRLYKVPSNPFRRERSGLQADPSFRPPFQYLDRLFQPRISNPFERGSQSAPSHFFPLGTTLTLRVSTEDHTSFIQGEVRRVSRKESEWNRRGLNFFYFEDGAFLPQAHLTANSGALPGFGSGPGMELLGKQTASSQLVSVGDLAVHFGPRSRRGRILNISFNRFLVKLGSQLVPGTTLQLEARSGQNSHLVTALLRHVRTFNGNIFRLTVETLA